MTDTLDREDVAKLVGKLSRREKTEGGLFALALKEGIWTPSSTDARNSGLLGKLIHKLVGNEQPGATPDYGDCELKTYARDSESAITLATFVQADKRRPFKDSHLFTKISKTVLVEHYLNNEYVKHGTIITKDRSIGFTNSFNLLSNTRLAEQFEKDYNSSLAEKSGQVALFLDTTSAKLPVWRMKKAFMECVAGTQTLADNPDFEW